MGISLRSLSAGTGPVLGLACVLGGSLLSGCLSTGGGQDDDPVVVENAVAFIKRPLLFDENSGQPVADNLADPSAFHPGARLYWKTSAAPDAPERDISSRAFPGAGYLDDLGRLRYDVKDLHVSHDGTRLLFAMRAPEIEGADDDEQPTWNIWEYDSTEDRLRRVIASDVVAEAGQDVAPAYLPDGRIVFSSTRQRQSKAVLLDEGKPQYAGLDEDLEVPAFVLHVMDSDGDNIQQITFNQSHDLDPMVAATVPSFSVVGTTPARPVTMASTCTGSTRTVPGLDYLYGRHSHQALSAEVAVQYLAPRVTDRGDLLVQLRRSSRKTMPRCRRGWISRGTLRRTGPCPAHPVWASSCWWKVPDWPASPRCRVRMVPFRRCWMAATGFW